jgi:hypothetical protein
MANLSPGIYYLMAEIFEGCWGCFVEMEHNNSSGGLNE